MTSFQKKGSKAFGTIAGLISMVPGEMQGIVQEIPFGDALRTETRHPTGAASFEWGRGVL
jgi:hypothetical protein